jgi:hypothetical protein
LKCNSCHSVWHGMCSLTIIKSGESSLWFFEPHCWSIQVQHTSRSCDEALVICNNGHTCLWARMVMPTCLQPTHMWRPWPFRCRRYQEAMVKIYPLDRYSALLICMYPQNFVSSLLMFKLP